MGAKDLFQPEYTGELPSDVPGNVGVAPTETPMFDFWVVTPWTAGTSDFRIIATVIYDIVFTQPRNTTISPELGDATMDPPEITDPV